MPYDVTYTEINNQHKLPITVADETLNNQTSLTFVGKNYAGYASYVATDLLHLLENFANPTSPTNPVQGQIWFDNVNNQLMVNNDGTNSNWSPTGSVQKSPTPPDVANIGDIWVDTINHQLLIYTGSSTEYWKLVGPLLSAGTVTGQKIESIEDSSNAIHNIISLYSSNTRVAIVSADAFTPKISITGYSIVNAGITLNSSSSFKFNGTSLNADSLGGVSSLKYVRSDQPNILTSPISVPSVQLGVDNNFILASDSVSSSNYIISSNTAGNSIEVRLLNSASVTKSIAHFSSLQRVGIATTTPTSTLDVNGDTTISSGILKVVSVADVSTIGTQTASIQTSGGLSVAQSAAIGTTLVINNGQLVLNKLDVTVLPNIPTAGSVIIPGYTTHSLSTTGVYNTISQPLYDIGSPTQRFRNFYIENFVGDVVGNVSGTLTGNVSGNVSGTAGSLASITAFSLTGDVSSAAINFDGSGSAVIFNTVVGPYAVSSKKLLPDSTTNDELLIHRQYAARVTGYITGTTLTIGVIEFGSSLIGTSMEVLGVDTTPIPTGSFIVGIQYTIVSIGVTTNIQWNTIAGTTGIVYAPGSVFTAAITGAGLGDGTAYAGVNNVIAGTTIVSGSGRSWVVSQSQTVGSYTAPVILYIGASELYKTTKQTFIGNIPTIQVGTIILYPGTVLPPGYLLCDGTIYLIAKYSALSAALGPTYAVTGSSVRFSVPTLPSPVTGINYIIYSGII